jgi:hypothetical protein
LPAERIIRVVFSSMPFCALITITAGLDGRQCRDRLPAKSGMPGVSTRWTWIPL